MIKTAISLNGSRDDMLDQTPLATVGESKNNEIISLEDYGGHTEFMIQA